MKGGAGERTSFVVLDQVLLGGAKGEGRGGQRWNVKWEGPEDKKAVITMYRLIFKALCPKLVIFPGNNDDKIIMIKYAQIHTVYISRFFLYLYIHVNNTNCSAILLHQTVLWDNGHEHQHPSVQ